MNEKYFDESTYLRSRSDAFEFMFNEQKKISDELRQIVDSYKNIITEKNIELAILKYEIKPIA